VHGGVGSARFGELQDAAGSVISATPIRRARSNARQRRGGVLIATLSTRQQSLRRLVVQALFREAKFDPIERKVSFIGCARSSAIGYIDDRMK
jgi:hypothetical protein